MPRTKPTMTEVRCASAPPPGGHYKQAILHGNTLYVSGQLGVTSTTVEPSGVAVADQMAFALGNVERIAGVVGSSRADVVKCTVYVADVDHWGEVDRAYAGFFGGHRPARSIVPCGTLHFGAKVEIEAIVAVAG